jgi:outer membrane protein assembly factor BamB
MTMKQLLRTLVLLTLVSPGAAGQERTVVRPQDTGAELTNPGLIKAHIQGGLIVHVGCGDGTLCTLLGEEPNCVVQGLNRDPLEVAQARATVRAKDRYGRVSIRQWRGESLPYADNLVNLIVVSRDESRVPPAEIARVLAPRGVALVPKGMAIDSLQRQPSSSGLDEYVKPVPEAIADWSHYFCNPDNNAVSQDTVVGPPKHMQWLCGPAYARSHEVNSSMAGMVSCGGRIFYIWDEGVLGQPEQRFPAKWSLIARDAFNGLPLWKLPMPDWGWREWHDPSRWNDPDYRYGFLRSLPKTTRRRLVATDDRLYATLGYEAPVSVLDAATGELLKTVAGTEGADELLLDAGQLILSIRNTDRSSVRPGQDFRLSQNPGKIVAYDVQTVQKLWESEADTFAEMTLAVRGAHVYYAKERQVVCLDRTTGRRLWASQQVAEKGAARTLVAHDKVVILGYGPVTGVVFKERSYRRSLDQAAVLSAETGELLWSSPQFRGPSGDGQDVFVIDGLVWFGVNLTDNLPLSGEDTETQRIGYDLLTGEAKRTVSVPMLTSPGHHYRCYQSKATQRYLLLPKRGVEYLDLKGDEHMRNDWLRAPCIYGVLPANGMLYVAPHQCVCYQGVLLSNFNALASQRVKGEARKVREEDRLVRGPAYGDLAHSPAPVELSTSTDWPMYRHDPRRSGAAETGVPDRLGPRWEVRLAAPITPPVVAQGKLLVAEKDAHTLVALDAQSGRRLWDFTAGGRIDSPPTVHGGLALFGCADGWVYCLDVSSGAEAWRFLAAPEERQVGAFGQLESAWPVHGTVIVQDDVTVNPPRPLAYFSAGRSTFLDGGMYFYALDPRTGDVRYRNHLAGPTPDPFQDKGDAGYMDGAKSDILVSDGADLFLHQERFRSDLERFPSQLEDLGPESGGYREYPAHPERGSNAMRLLSSRGFLDDSYNEGTYWAFSQRWPGWDRKMRKIAALGQLLVFNEQTVFGVNVFSGSVGVRRGFFPGKEGYRLFAKPYEPGTSEDDFRKTEDAWSVHIPVRVRAMVLAGDKLFVAGPPDVVPEDDPTAAFEGRRGGDLWAFSATTGKKIAEICHTDAPPVYDALIAAGESLYLSTTDGTVYCFGANEQ